MPLLDDLAQRVLPPRQEDQLRREQQAVLAGEDPVTKQPAVTVREQLDQRASQMAKQEQAQGAFADILKNLQTGIGAGTDALSSLLTTRTVPGTTPSITDYEKPAVGSPIIGTKRYHTGRGAPALRQFAQQTAQSMGWDARQFAAWDAIINAESSWNPSAKNPTSTAYGLGQFLNSTWGSYGPKTTDPRLQLQYMARYIRDRYGTPEKALAFHNSRDWY